IQQVRRSIPASIPVTTADTIDQLLAHPNVVAAVDQVMVNYHPFWAGVSVNSAICLVNTWHKQITAAAGAKKVIVSETGWPSAGNTVGSAVPSFNNARLYFISFVSWARANNVDYFYFEGLDESWKAAYEGPQGAAWGIWDKNGIL